MKGYAEELFRGIRSGIWTGVSWALTLWVLCRILGVEIIIRSAQ